MGKECHYGGWYDSEDRNREGLRTMNTENKFVTTQCIAKRWDMHEESTRRLLRSGKLTGFKAGPVTWRISFKAVLAYEAGNVQEEGRVTS